VLQLFDGVESTCECITAVHVEHLDPEYPAWTECSVFAEERQRQQQISSGSRPPNDASDGRTGATEPAKSIETEEKEGKVVDLDDEQGRVQVCPYTECGMWCRM
jgi:hypothetical protein